MHFRLRYIYALCFVVIIFYLFCTKYKSNAPIHVVTKLLYEPGHDIENAKICRGRDPPKVFIGVVSAPKNVAERNVIRATWANLTRQADAVVAFFVGKSLDTELNRQITKESSIYSDIVRSNNVDSYMNLTLKTISLLEWTHQYCSKALFVMKCDDDIFINVTNLLAFVNINLNSKRTIFGELGKDLSPLWWPPKWYVSSAEYSKPKYPDFVFGPAYLVSSDSVNLLYRHALETEFFRLEDVFITGIIAESAKIKRVGTSLFIRSDYTPQIKAANNFHLLKEAKMRITIHGISLSERIELWNLIEDKFYM